MLRIINKGILMIIKKVCNLFFILVLYIFSLVYAEETINSQNKVEEFLPHQELKDLNNKRIEINDFIESGPMLISFWFLACEPCKKEMKFLNEYNNEYFDRGFKVISINTDNSRGFRAVKPFIKSKKYSFKVLSDPNGKFMQKIGGQVCPYTLLVDHNGAIYSRHIGFQLGDEKKIKEEILLLLGIFESDSLRLETKLPNEE